MKAPSTHAHTPLWGNSCLPTLLTLPDIEVWITHGVIYLSQIYSISVRSFQDLKLAFNMFFHFFQLRHMLLVQFGDSIHNLTSLYPLDVFLGADSKKWTSTFYSSLLQPAVTELTFQLKTQWMAAVAELEDKGWEDVLASCKFGFPQTIRLPNYTYIHTHIYNYTDPI